MAAVLALSPYKTAVQLWQEKTGRAEPDKPDKMRQRAMDRGKKLEPVVVEMAIDRLREQGHTVDLIGTNKRYQHPDYPFLSCEIDFELMLDDEHVTGDCKTSTGFMRNQWGEEQTDEVPVHYACQFMHGLNLTGRNRCCCAALIGLDDVKIYWVERDQATIDFMQKKAVDFWENHVLKDIPPDPVKFEDVSLIFPADNGEAIEASPDIVLNVRELLNIKDEINQLSDRADELKLSIAEYISPHARLEFFGRTIATWRTQSHSTFDLHRFREECPVVAAEYTLHKEHRILRTPKEK